MSGTPILVIGGAGVFGRLIVSELLSSSQSFDLTAAGRHPAHIKKVFSGLQSKLQFAQCDLKDVKSLDRVLSGKKIVIVAAGPFQALDPQIARLAGERGIHYLDICDDPDYFSKILSQKAFWHQGKGVCIPGLSSLPGISLTLFESLRPQLDEIQGLRIGMFIGNKNAKGLAAMSSALANSRGAPQTFSFPEPIGKVSSIPLSTPESLILKEQFPQLEVKSYVAFEKIWTRVAFKFLRSKGPSPKLLRVLNPFIRLSSWLGSEWGCISVELRGKSGSGPKALGASLWAEEKGQRLAVMQVVLAAESLAQGEIKSPGLYLPQQWQDPRQILERMVKRGFRWEVHQA